jgi:hypothetical protein
VQAELRAAMTTTSGRRSFGWCGRPQWEDPTEKKPPVAPLRQVVNGSGEDLCRREVESRLDLSLPAMNFGARTTCYGIWCEVEGGRGGFRRGTGVSRAERLAIDREPPGGYCEGESEDGFY